MCSTSHDNVQNNLFIHENGAFDMATIPPKWLLYQVDVDDLATVDREKVYDNNDFNRRFAPNLRSSSARVHTTQDAAGSNTELQDQQDDGISKRGEACAEETLKDRMLTFHGPEDWVFV